MIDIALPIPRNINAGNSKKCIEIDKFLLEMFTYGEVFQSKDLQFFLPDK